MTYQRASEVPKKRPEQETRIEKLLSELSIPFRVNMLFCASCRHLGPNMNGDRYPSSCPNCYTLFDGPGQYSLPDFVIDRTGILYVNGDVHEKAKNVRKDREQIKALSDAGYAVFVIKNEEIDYTTDSGLKQRLLGIHRAVKDPSLHTKIYRNEREYACLR